ncbi:MAG TPA: zinc ribbon domain-containing protein [Pyrinomonadaceae bacterium]|nr:zinc ribbon domain-containing protein [Pyrinomonadaceae bacterium]
MFCPQCGHQQVSDDTSFCSRCGVSFGLVTNLVSNSSNQLQREKRELTGVALMMATVLLLLNFLLVFGVVTLPHLANPVFLWIWLFFMVSSLAVGGLGLVNLIRGDFFKRLKQREARFVLMKAEQDRKKLSTESETTPLLNAPVSVTETTTRELEPVSKRQRRGIDPQ